MANGHIKGAGMEYWKYLCWGFYLVDSLGLYLVGSWGL